jgi:hypothetical protein
MLTFRHIGATAIATVVASAMVIDTADARRGGSSGGGARAGNPGGGARVADAGSVRRTYIGRAGRPGFRPGWGWGGGWGGPSWGWGAAAAVGTGLAYASSGYCDPYYGPCNGGGFVDYGSSGYAPPTYGANYGSIVPSSTSYGSYANGTYGSLGVSRPVSYAIGYAAAPEAVAECARRFRSYDPASLTYLASNGQRVPCP